ncbi:MAG: DinB family protein [Acidobacteriota bacterium]
MMNTTQLIADIERSREQLLQRVQGLSAETAARKPSASEWSVLDNVEHLYLAELSGVAKIWAALDALGQGQRWTGERPNDGKPIEAIIAATWQPKETAPPIATPHIGGPLAFWISATRSLTPVLADLGRGLANVTLEDVVFPHFLCGPLDARQRLAFLRFHIDRHIEQIGRVLRG